MRAKNRCLKSAFEWADCRLNFQIVYSRICIFSLIGQLTLHFSWNVGFLLLEICNLREFWTISMILCCTYFNFIHRNKAGNSDTLFTQNSPNWFSYCSVIQCQAGKCASCVSSYRRLAHDSFQTKTFVHFEIQIKMKTLQIWGFYPLQEPS